MLDGECTLTYHEIMKLKTIYICRECGNENPNWSGKCSSCSAWNSFEEDVVDISKNKISSTARKLNIKSAGPLLQSLKEVEDRASTNITEFDRVLGGGIVKGSITLLSGEPGIGKSTLTLQIANNIAKEGSVLLISGEESLAQIAKRAERLKLKCQNLNAVNEHNLESILESIKKEKPTLAIIDSIQVISSMDLSANAGSVSQVRYCTERLMELAKSSNISILLIGHVTKQGNLAGPRVLEHLVDSVLHLEGDRYQNFRILKSAKNRFGSCNEVGIFEMGNTGMQEVTNPSKQLMKEKRGNSIGSVITVSVEGTRPLLVEVQALAATSPFGYPKRTSNGFDLNRLQILIAVLEKYGRINLQNQDIFINVIGGIKLNEPAADLAVLMAIASSFLKKAIDPDTTIFGEVGLSGEIRSVNNTENRQKEAKKMGLLKSIDPSNSQDILKALKKI
jgi:DNA repair protein RadA/Sms